MKKKSLLKTAIMGVVLLLALSMVTCELDLPGKPGEGDLDWEFVELPDGTAQLTLWLDGSTPVKAGTQTRALNLGIAKRSHDYFEAVFIAENDVVARSNWEIGQAAGIRGVPRGVAYDGVTGAVNSTQGRSMVLVGRKVGSGSEGTLLGVGYMTHVDGAPITSTTPIATGTRNVTFTVSALSTRIGYDFSYAAYPTTWGASPTPTPPPTPPSTYPPRDTFLTGAKTPGASTNPSFDDTLIGTATFKNNATYSMFGLPTFDKEDASKNVITAKYTVGGLSLGAEAAGTGATIYSGIDLSLGLFIADCGTDDDGLIPPFQVIERLAIYQTLGQTYDVIEADLDTVTTVNPTSSYITDSGAGKNFPYVIELQFDLFEKSGGAFAFTWQIPVFALAPTTAGSGFPAPSTNGGPDAIYWYIRPAHGQQQYLLDNGMTTGGAVLMGVGVGSLDWLEIIVHGFGFSNKPVAPPSGP